MSDKEIIALLFARNEQGLTAMQGQYGSFCIGIMHRLLGNAEDLREAENDLWLQIWNSIPPAQPENLKAYLAKAARNTAIHYLEREGAQKRKHVTVLLSELSECVPDPASHHHTDAAELREALNGFVGSLSPQERAVFVHRYWYGESIAELQTRTGWTKSRLLSLLHRLRKRLKKHLEKEGVWCE